MWGKANSRALCALVVGLTLTSTAVKAQVLPTQWQGWYAGGILGFAWTDVDLGIASEKSSDSYNSVTGGVLGGYNFQLSDTIIFGLESDITFADLSGSVSLARHKVSFLGRIGALVTPTTLMFVSTGLAGGQYEAEVTVTDSNTVTMVVGEGEGRQQTTTTTTTTGRAERDKRLWGLTIGGGFETELNVFAFPVRWGLEYRYTDFEKWNFTALGQSFSIEPEVQEVRVRFVVPLN